MKSFKQFNEDASFAKRSIGTGLLNFAGNVAKSLGTQPIEKGVRAVTSFASTMDDFKKRRDAQKKYKEAINKGIQNTRDSEADKEVAKAAKDPDLEKLDRLYDTDNREFNKDVKSYRKTIDKDTKKTTLPPEDQIQRLKDAKNKYKKPKK
tara:strand:+ start:3156 stop:3605 length:450 start_codon:yes stop_codon:yes gene_type:complete